MVSELLIEIQKRVATAAEKAGRSPKDVRLIAVSKGQPAEKLKEALEAGQQDFGENYAQEFSEHVGAVHEPPTQIQWHFIGHLQRNKVKQILPHVFLIHSVDSLELAQEIDKRAAALNKIQPILIEVNLGGEDSKTGISPENIEKLVRSINSLSHLDLQGFMTIPPFHENPEEVRPYFRRLREIRDAINNQLVYKHALSALSMGMTQDFEVAIEEGSTMVRVGTGIFGKRS